jgi:hypothetical protein
VRSSGPAPPPKFKSARDVAEAQIDLRRIRCARDRVLSDAWNRLHDESRRADGPQKLGIEGAD